MITSERASQYPVEFVSMFREYDIRGHVSDVELNPTNVHRIVSAYAKFLLARGMRRAVVGYDNRECSPSFADAAIDALRTHGIDVVFIGLAITPAMYFAQYHYKCEGGVMITASHNPSDWSGFKFAKGYSKTLEPADIVEVFELLDGETPAAELGALDEDDVRNAYLDAIVSRIHMGPSAPKVVIEAGNGGAGLFAYELFQRLGCITFQLYCDPDITYPHYFPNPSDMRVRAKMSEMVTHPYVKADLGMSFDGDGDRLGVVDDQGNNLWSDVVLAVLAKQLLEKKPGAKVVFDVKCSQTLPEVISANGGTPVMWKTGHSYIKAKMHEIGAELAGERSGHIFVGGDDWYGFDDAMFVAAKLVEYLSNTGQTLRETVAAFPHYVTSPEIKAFCPDDKKYEVSERVTQRLKEMFGDQVCDINGARVQFEDGWGLQRPSSNLPEIVLVFEGTSDAAMRRIRQTFRDVLLDYPEISSNWENDVQD